MSKSKQRNKGSKRTRQPQDDNRSPQGPRANQQRGHIAQLQQFSGPLPSPTILEQYNRVIPGAAERIIAMAEKDAEHQRDMERTALAAERRERRTGQIFALIIGLSALAAAVGCAYVGATAVAATIGGGTVVGLVTVFVTGRILGE